MIAGGQDLVFGQRHPSGAARNTWRSIDDLPVETVETLTRVSHARVADVDLMLAEHVHAEDIGGLELPPGIGGRRTEETSEWRIEGCLLYTSPSPRDRTRSRMPSSA